MKRGIAAVALSIVLVTGCSEAAAPTDPLLSDAEARAIIDDMLSGWDAPVASGEPGANAAVYMDDGIRMQPDMPALIGREAIQAWMEEQAAAYTFEGSNEIFEVRRASAGWIMFRGEGSFVGTPRAGGEPLVMEEQWLSLAQRQPEGTWKVYRNAGNSVLPR